MATTFPEKSFIRSPGAPDEEWSVSRKGVSAA
jgi:hypothetical protein